MSAGSLINSFGIYKCLRYRSDIPFRKVEMRSDEMLRISLLSFAIARKSDEKYKYYGIIK